MRIRRLSAVGVTASQSESEENDERERAETTGSLSHTRKEYVTPCSGASFYEVQVQKLK